MDYSGSTGYGRAYRNRLQGTWGVLDVADCVAVVRWLGEQRWIDPARAVIRGGSAGGFTVLMCLAVSDVFAAGADYYGVADVEALALETHKFETRYLDGLIAPYPEGRDVYIERSPLTHLDSLSSPLVVFQGAEDQVVPPAQSEAIVAALREKGLPVAYRLYDGEQHGFRQARNIKDSLEAELSVLLAGAGLRAARRRGHRDPGHQRLARLSSARRARADGKISRGRGDETGAHLAHAGDLAGHAGVDLRQDRGPADLGSRRCRWACP